MVHSRKHTTNTEADLCVSIHVTRKSHAFARDKAAFDFEISIGVGETLEAEQLESCYSAEWKDWLIGQTVDAIINSLGPDGEGGSAMTALLLPKSASRLQP